MSLELEVSPADDGGLLEKREVGFELEAGE